MKNIQRKKTTVKKEKAYKPYDPGTALLCADPIYAPVERYDTDLLVQVEYAQFKQDAEFDLRALPGASKIYAVYTFSHLVELNSTAKITSKKVTL